MVKGLKDGGWGGLIAALWWDSELQVREDERGAEQDCS